MESNSSGPVPYLCRKHGVSDATFCKWRSKYGGMAYRPQPPPTTFQPCWNYTNGIHYRVKGRPQPE
ncbi:transposase [Yoonia sp. SS1-5]|uniref:Transposase n=1 Tax=Yoonia rhodophyticola TaxID=3137370 RepID=A0ABZ3JCH5_9RHOB